MAAAEELRCRCVDKDVLEDIDSAFILKEEQRNAGFGKSLIYQLAPMMTTLL